MSKSFTFERFDLKTGVQDNDCHVCGAVAYSGDASREQSEFDGAWVRAEDAINREAVNADEIRTLKAQWRCFHCDETFTDEAAARLHFGTSLMHSPACTIDVAEYRAMEARMKLYNEEDSDLHREIAGMQSTHRTALRREEEKGYARGLAASTAALLTLDKLKYTYTQGAELWKPPIGPNPFARTPGDGAQGEPAKFGPDFIGEFTKAGVVYESPDVNRRLLIAARAIDARARTTEPQREGVCSWTGLKNHEFDMLCEFSKVDIGWQDQNADVTAFGQKLLVAAIAIDTRARA